MKYRLLRSEEFCKWVIIYSTIIYIYSTNTKTNALSTISMCFSMLFEESYFQDAQRKVNSQHGLICSETSLKDFLNIRSNTK